MLDLLCKFAAYSDECGEHKLADATDALITAPGKESELKEHMAMALFAFMGWLTTRGVRSGPFSGRDECGEAAELVGEYCAKQGWEMPRDPHKERLMWAKIQSMDE
jgi:hypothetical protein